MGVTRPTASPSLLADGRRILSNPDGLRRWRAVMAAARYRQASMVIAGDSIALGAYSDDVAASGDEATWRVRGWVPQLRSLFADRYGDPGEGFVWAGDPRVTVSGGAARSTSSSVGPFKTSISINGNSQVSTWVLPACTDIVVYSWWDGVSNTRAWEYQIDGGGYSISAGSTGNDHLYNEVIATGLANTTHTVNIRGSTLGGSIVSGVGAFKNARTSGVAVHRLPNSGKMLKDFTQLFDGSSTTAIRNIRSSTQALGAKLVVLAFSANNVTQGNDVYGLNPAQVAAGHALVIDQIVSDGACVLCVGGPWRDPGSYSTPATQQQYDDAIKAVCVARDHAAYLDIKKSWESYSAANTLGYYIDSIHPKLLGHSHIANLVYQGIGGV